MVSVGGDEVVRDSQAAAGLDIWAPAAAGAWEIGEDFVSPCYGRREMAAVATLSVNGTGQTDIVTVLTPRGEAGPKWAARALQTAPGRCLAVEGPDTIDLVLIGPAAVAEPLASRTDFEWARVSRAGSRVLEWLGVRGQSFDLDGRFGFRANQPVDWASAAWSNGELRLDFEPVVSVEVALGEDVSRLVVNGRPADTRGDETSGVKIRLLNPSLQNTDVRH
jgi:hypothetical protein